MPMVLVSNREKLILFVIGPCQSMSTKSSSSLDFVIIIANLFCGLVRSPHLLRY